MGTLTIGEYYLYLGIQIEFQDNTDAGVYQDLQDQLIHVTQAPLKPQQRLHILKVHLIPGLQFRMIFQRTSGTLLKRMDRSIRAAVRKWLILPGDLPIEAFYANIEDGGLQLPNLRYGLPIAKVTRLKKMDDSADPLVRKLTKVEPTKTKLRTALKMCQYRGERFERHDALKAKMGEALWTTCDGKGLKTEPGQVRRRDFKLLKEGDTPLFSKHFLAAWSVRLNTLVTPCRKNRGGRVDEVDRFRCDKCGSRSFATLGHISQSCAKTHGLRVQRHDRVVKQIIKALERCEGVLEVRKEPRLKPIEKPLLVPDILVRTVDQVYIVDVQVISDAGVRRDLEEGPRSTGCKQRHPSVRTCIFSNLAGKHDEA